jgi:hypothetical protein
MARYSPFDIEEGKADLSIRLSSRSRFSHGRKITSGALSGFVSAKIIPPKGFDS